MFLSKIYIVGFILFVSVYFVSAEETKLIASDGTNAEMFGFSVNIKDDYSIIGSYQHDSNGNNNSGAAYIFHKVNSVWGEEAILIPTDAESGDNWGRSVAIDGSYAIISSIYDDDMGADAGAAYIFEKDESWTQKTKLFGSDLSDSDAFGVSVSIQGNFAVVGCNGADEGYSNTGAAYVFERQGGIWTQVAKLVADDAEENDHFGNSVSIDNNLILIGCPRKVLNTIETGAAYIFKKQDNEWIQSAKLTSDDYGLQDNFGISVSLDGNFALIGARHHDIETETDAGTAYIFYNNGTNWIQNAKLIASDAQSDDEFGYSVSLYGNYAIIGSRYESTNGYRAGAAYSYLYNGDSWIQKDKVVSNEIDSEDEFGYSVSIYGNDIIIGARNADGSSAYSGAAFIYNAVEDFSLPVELSSFNCISGNGHVNLQWITESEVDNLGFEIIRSTTKESDYILIDSYESNRELRGSINSSSSRKYTFTDNSVINGFTYWYKLIDVDINGIKTEHGPISATPNAEGIDLHTLDNNLSKEFNLYQNYPNPFNPETTIKFDIPENKTGLADLSISIYNQSGQLVKSLFTGSLANGSYKLKWNGKSGGGKVMPSGLYYLHFKSDNFVTTKKMVLMR